MARWEPDARGRLEHAALELYRDRGFDQTTVAEIAKRAGLAERTFFRYFADKREVLFWESALLQDHLVKALEDTPESLLPMDAVGLALQAAGPVLEARRHFAEQRQAIIAANAELQERELIKLSKLASALAEGLRRRGVDDPAATLAAEAGIAAFKVAFGRWTEEVGKRTLAEIVRASVDELKTIAGAGPSPGTR